MSMLLDDSVNINQELINHNKIFEKIQKKDDSFYKLQNFDYDYETITVFSHGDCWVLAKELHEITGWDLHWLGTSKGCQLHAWCHVFVTTPEGYPLDIAGIHDPETFHYKWRRIAKSWGVINKPREYKTEQALSENIHLMTMGMRPKFFLGTSAYNHAINILDKIGYDMSTIKQRETKNIMVPVGSPVTYVNPGENVLPCDCNLR